MDLHTAYSAVKIDVSDVATSCESKVLVLSHESSTRDVITSLLKKLKMRDHDSSAFVVEAEILAEKDIAILQFEDDDRLMQAYQQFPKGSIRLCMRYKSEFDMDIADEKKAGKGGLNGHQLTLQRIRRSLEKLKRKSSSSNSKQAVVQSEESPAPSTPRSARPPIKPQSPTKVKSQGVSASTAGSNTRGQRAPVTSVSSPRGLKAPVASVTTPRGHRSPGTLDKSTTPTNGTSDRRREYRNRNDRSRRRSYAGDEQSGHKSPYSLSNTKHLSYKTTTVPQVGSGAVSDTECMIFYDSASDVGSVSHIPSHNAPVTSRSHIMPRHIEHQHNGQSVMIDKPMKMSFKNLEDSGIDVKSPPNSGNVRERVNSLNDMEYRKPTPSKPTANGHSQESYFSPTISESSPFSFVSANEAHHVKRTGSFSSLKSLPVTVFKEIGGDSPYLFQPLTQEPLSRTKSQSMTNLHNNKVVRRRSLPPLDVSQEKLEQKKSSLSKRLAKKISNFRNNEKRYMLPSPHTFTSQNLQQYKEKAVSDNARKSVSDNIRKRPVEVDNDDNSSLADMEVAHILEGKPEHPTDSDVEDYLACVESTNTTQSESQHGEPEQLESTPYSQLDKYHAQKSSKQYVDHGNSHKQYVDNNHVDHGYSHKKYVDNSHTSSAQKTYNSHESKGPKSFVDGYHSQKNYIDTIDHNENSSKHIVNTQSALKPHTLSKYEHQDLPHTVKPQSHDAVRKLSSDRSHGQSHDVGKSMDSGIESAYSRNVHSKVSQDEKTKSVIVPPKPKKSLNKFVEQSMQSFLNDCHQSTTLTDAEILAMHHAALQSSIHSPNQDITQHMQISPNLKSPTGQSNFEADAKSAITDSKTTPVYVNQAALANQNVSEYEQARARFVQMQMNTGSGDVINGIHNSRTDTTYKSNVQLKLQKSDVPVATSDMVSQNTPRRRSHGDNALVNQSANDTHKSEQADENWAGKPLTLFTIVRTHCIMSVFIEKGSSKTFGISVKRTLFTNCGTVKDTTGSQNVVVVHELLPNSPADVTSAVFPNDVIIEINGHSVLQSSDKVVKTLLDARSVLEIVIAREQKRLTDKFPMVPTTSKSPLVFHNMDEISTDNVQCNYARSSGHLSARSKQYEQRTESDSSRYRRDSNEVRSGPTELWSGPNELRAAPNELRFGPNEHRSVEYEASSGPHEQRSYQYDQGYSESGMSVWNAKIAQYDSVITSPRFNQLSEGPTFLL